MSTQLSDIVVFTAFICWGNKAYNKISDKIQLNSLKNIIKDISKIN